MKLRINIGDGDIPGFQKAKFDPLVFPWPIKDGSVDELYCANLVCRVPHADFFRFFEEVQRVLKRGAGIQLLNPYYTSAHAFRDPLAVRFVSEGTFAFLNKDFRKANAYPAKTTANFDMVRVDHSIQQELKGKAAEAIQYAAGHYWNAVEAGLVVLRKRT